MDQKIKCKLSRHPLPLTPLPRKVKPIIFNELRRNPTNSNWQNHNWSFPTRYKHTKIERKKEKGIPSSQSCRRKYQITCERLVPLRLFSFFFFTRFSKSESDEIGECTMTIQVGEANTFTIIWWSDKLIWELLGRRNEEEKVALFFLRFFSSFFYFYLFIEKKK